MGVAVSLIARASVFRAESARAIAVAALVVIVVGFTAVLGARRSVIAVDWYRVVDDSVIAGLDWLDQHRVPDARVLTTSASRGHNYGWWIEGHTTMPAYTAADVSLFVDPAERDKVRLAERLMSVDATQDEIRDAAARENIRFMFLDTQNLGASPWTLIDAGFVPRFEHGSILVMERTE